MHSSSETQTFRAVAAGCARSLEMTGQAKPCGFRTHLGNRCAIPTLPPPRRLLDSFNTKSRKELSSAMPSGFLQAHSSIRKDCGGRAALRKALDNAERAPADGAGRAEDGDAFHCAFGKLVRNHHPAKVLAQNCEIEETAHRSGEQ